MLKNGQLWGSISENKKIEKTTLQPNKRRSVQRMPREKKKEANSRKLHNFETRQK